MLLDELREYFTLNHLSDETYNETIKILEKLWLEEKTLPNEEISQKELLRRFIKSSYQKKETTIDFFLALLRYTSVKKDHDSYIFLTRYTGMIDVLENIFARFRSLHSTSEYEALLKDLSIPRLGMDPEDIPGFTKEFMNRLEQHYSEVEVEQILTGNNHSLSEKSVLPEKLLYEAAPSLEVYLKERHLRKIEELTHHYQEKKVWFEQWITQDVIDYVSSNQEILSAKIENEKLYITKIPYDTDAYLKAKTDTEKRYHGCHCSFAKESIRGNNAPVSGRWCYCSAGFAKFPFEIILGQKLPIKVINNCLDGDLICRFEIDLEGISYKK
ncbi:MAG: hypothetical protein AB7U79_07160 [Candidatus Izemoplasmatales bacterium]